MNKILTMIHLTASVLLIAFLSPLVFLTFVVDCLQKRDVIARRTRSNIEELKLPQYTTPQELKI